MFYLQSSGDNMTKRAILITFAMMITVRRFWESLI